MRSKLSILLALLYMLFQVFYALISMDNYDYLYFIWWVINGSYIPYIILTKYNTNLEIKLRKIVALFIGLNSLFGALDSVLNLSNTLYSIVIMLYIIISLSKLIHGRRAIK